MVGFACRRPRAVALACLVLVLAGGLHLVRNFAMDTDVVKLFPPDLPWRQTEEALSAAFPQREDLIVAVVDGVTPDVAERASAALDSALRARPELFRSVRRPGAGAFFRRHALLYLPLEELRATTERLIEAQPLLGTLAADPTLRGVAHALDLMAEGVARGETTLASLDRPLGALARSAEAARAGRVAPLDWTALLTDRPPSRLALRRFVLVQPVLDFSALSPGAAATEAIRAEIARLGLTEDAGVRVRLTGPVVLSDDEFATLGESATLTTALSIAFEAALLFLALRSVRVIAPVLLTVLAGLVLTGAFGLLAFGAFNLLSVAFAVLFIGLGEDLTAQYAVRYREERHLLGDRLEEALRATGHSAGPAMLLAALAIAGSFFALAPGEFRGVSELGVIAGTGMLVGWLLSLTLLPALLLLFRAPGEAEPIGFAVLGRIEAALVRRARAVVTAALLLALGCLALLPRVPFDFNPMNLRDARKESVATIRDLMRDIETTPNTLDVLAPSLEAAAALAARLEALPEVGQARTLLSFVPADQEEKLALIADAASLLGPSLAAAEAAAAPPATDAAVARALAAASEALARAARGRGEAANVARAAAALRAVAEGPPEGRARLAAALLPGLRDTLDRLAEALAVTEPFGPEDLPPDLRRDWLTPDGRARVEVAPRDLSDDNRVLRRFARAVQAVAPEASGPPVSMLEASASILRSFLQAGAFALALVTALLLAALRDLRLVVLALAPLGLAGLMTLAITALFGPALNLANIIALPLLFGIGVAFDVYYVAAWKAGRRSLLATGLTRAVLFSTLTTFGAFGTLILSSHPGTASMGVLLTLSLACILLAVLVTLPPMLRLFARPRR
nr:MMPL family transporter [Caldovatus aquaticus]